MNLKTSKLGISVEQQLFIFLTPSQPENGFCSQCCSKVRVALLGSTFISLSVLDGRSGVGNRGEPVLPPLKYVTFP